MKEGRDRVANMEMIFYTKILTQRSRGKRREREGMYKCVYLREEGKREQFLTFTNVYFDFLEP